MTYSEFRWQVATTLARWSGKRQFKWFKRVLGLLLLVGVFLVGWVEGKKQGIVKGIDFYHEACYTTGGIVVDEKQQAIICGPLGILPKKELDKEDFHGKLNT